MQEVCLTNEEIASIRSIVNEVKRIYNSVEDEKFLVAAATYAHDLPRRLRQFLHSFKMREADGLCLISGYPIVDDRIGNTPAHWNLRPAPSPTLDEDILFLLLSSLLGDAFGWATQQGGYIIHEVVPIKEYEDVQIGVGSKEPIWWHNEDAFHNFRGDYIGLVCLRNPDRVATTFASIDMIEMDPTTVEILFEPSFIIRPDASHQYVEGDDPNQTVYDHRDRLKLAYERLLKMSSEPVKAPVLSGDPQSPYLCVDPYFMAVPDGDEKARWALKTLIEALDTALLEVVLKPGDFCFIDNYRAVHGRRPFTAEYDGRDRWVKRINITRDLRKSRGARATHLSRIIY